MHERNSQCLACSSRRDAREMSAFRISACSSARQRCVTSTPRPVETRACSCGKGGWEEGCSHLPAEAGVDGHHEHVVAQVEHL